MATIPNSVWFDPAWDAGVMTQDDGGTLRVTSMQSRPIHTQYTVSQGTLSIAPAQVDSPNGKKILSFGGAHYLSGAGGLAALLQGSAAYSEVHVVAHTASGTGGRWGVHQAVASPDNRVLHWINGSNLTIRWRSAVGATANTGSAVPFDGTAVVHSSTYSGADYDGWLDSASETLTGGGANTRAPATLDEMLIGSFWSAGAPAGFWTGTQAGLVICPGTVLSTTDRQALEIDLAAYYGY